MSTPAARPILLDLADHRHRAIAASILAELIHARHQVCEDKANVTARHGLDQVAARLVAIGDA